MYISYNWLKNYLPTLDKVDVNELSEKISGALAEVEQIIEKGSELKNIVVGEIKKVEKHPKSKSLMIAQVDTGDKIRQIVFAASNKEYVQPGSFYPVCLPEGKIYNPGEPFGEQSAVEITQKEFKGEESEGILCSPKELSVLDEQQGISIIGNDMNPGDNLTPLLKDYIFEIENKSLTHRSDCFSHRGIAREIAAIMNIDYLKKEPTENPIKVGDKPIDISVKDRNICQRFSAITLENIEVKKSPTWMQILLAYVGTRPINNIVDISNYLMLDIGYPIHMYDYDKLEGKKLIVRKAKNKEKVEALNEKKYELDNEMVVVADKKEVQDIAGIMGGAKSEVSFDTKNLVIESACWDMFNIRRTMMNLGISSEAGVRFSKGLSPEGTLETVQRAAGFVEDLAGGDVASQMIDIQNQPTEDKYITFNLKNVKRLIGIEIDKNEIIAILESLQINVLGKEDIPADEIVSTAIKLQIPHYRRDLNIQQDIVEEIARIYGYVNIKPTLPTRSIKAVQLNPDSEIIQKTKKYLSEGGLDEIYTYSFISKELYDNCNLDINLCLEILNPLSPELAYFRSQILPSLIEKIELNINNFQKIDIFEISKIANKKNIIKEDSIPSQERQIGGLIATKQKKENLYDVLKEKVDYLFYKFNLKADYKPLPDKNQNNNDILKIFHPSKTASILIDKEKVGYIGILHPKVQNNFEYTSYSIAIFQIEYPKIKNAILNTEFEYKPIVYTQEAERDLSFWIDDRTELGAIINKIKNKSIENLKDIETIDVYTDKKEKRSVTLRFVLQNPDKTLKEKDIDSSMKKIQEIIKENQNIRLRTK